MSNTNLTKKCVYVLNITSSIKSDEECSSFIYDLLCSICYKFHPLKYNISKGGKKGYTLLSCICSIWAGKLYWLNQNIAFSGIPVTCYLLSPPTTTTRKPSYNSSSLPVDRIYQIKYTILLFNQKYKRRWLMPFLCRINSILMQCFKI